MAITYRQAIRAAIMAITKTNKSVSADVIREIIEHFPFTEMQYVDTCLPTPINRAEKKKNPRLFTQIAADCRKNPSKLRDLKRLNTIAFHIDIIMTRYEHNPHVKLVKIQKEMYKVLHYLHMYLLKKTSPNSMNVSLDDLGYFFFMKVNIKHGIFKFDKKLLLEWLNTNQCSPLIELISDRFYDQDQLYAKHLTFQDLHSIMATGLENRQYEVVLFTACWFSELRNLSFLSQPECATALFKCFNVTPTRPLLMMVGYLVHTRNYDLTLRRMDPSVILRIIKDTNTTPDVAAVLGLRYLLEYHAREYHIGIVPEPDMYGIIVEVVEHILSRDGLTRDELISYKLTCLQRTLSIYNTFSWVSHLFEGTDLLEHLDKPDNRDYALRIWYTLSQTYSEYRRTVYEYESDSE